MTVEIPAPFAKRVETITENELQVRGMTRDELRYNFSFPMVLDNMTDEAESKYAALPERLYVLDEQGRIAYKGGLGPFCFDVDEFDDAVKQVTAVTQPE